MVKKLVSFFFLMSVMTIVYHVIDVNGFDTAYQNDFLVSFTKQEMNHMKSLGLSEVEIALLSAEEKNRYLNISTQHLTYSEVYYETKLITLLNGEIVIEDREVDEQEAISIINRIAEQEAMRETSKSSPNPTQMRINNCEIDTICDVNDVGGGGGDGTSPPVRGENETAMKKLKVYQTYNTNTKKVFFRVTLEWKTVPSTRLNDLIAIQHNSQWQIDKTTVNGNQRPVFYGKQIYRWTQYDSWIYRATGGLNERSHQYKAFNYNNSNISNYSGDTMYGILMSPNLKNDEVYYYKNQDATEGSPYHDPNKPDQTTRNIYKGYKVTDFIITLEGTFHKTIQGVLTAPFNGVYRHLTRQWEFNWGAISITYLAPYISVAGNVFGLITYYDEPIAKTIEIDSQ